MTLPLTSPIAAQWVPFLSRYAVEDVKQVSSTACGRGKGPIACDGIGEGESILPFSTAPSSLRRQGSSLVRFGGQHG